MRFQGTSRRIRKISVAKFIVYVTQNLLHSFVRFGGRSRFGPAAQSGVRGRGRYQRPRLQDQHGDHRHQEQARLAGGYRHFAQIRLGVARPADFLRAAGAAHQARGERRNRPQVQFGRHPRAGGVPAHPFPAHLRRSGLHGGQQLQAEARGRPAPSTCATTASSRARATSFCPTAANSTSCAPTTLRSTSVTSFSP